MSWTAAFLLLPLPGPLPGCQDAAPQARFEQGPAQQGPAEQRPATAQKTDVIELTTGAQLEGEIVSETDDYVEVRLGQGTTVGFERGRIARILRSSSSAVAPAPEVAALQPRDQWFVLHDAEGMCVGSLHSTVTRDDRGQVRLGEEWQFRSRGDVTEVTLLEIVTAELRPVSSFYHERRRRPDGKIADERLVQGEIAGDSFVVQRKTLAEQRRTVYPLEPALSFPLMLAEKLRQQPKWTRSEVHVLFDPTTEQFERREFSAEWRQVTWRDDVVDVREVECRYHDTRNTEWLDASSQTLRREVNGSSLVAVPVAAEATHRYMRAMEPVFPATVAVDPGSRFALWLPNPSWQVVPSQEPGRVVIQEPLHGATACLLTLEQIDPDVLVVSAAEDVARWLQVVKPGLRDLDRQRVTVRGCDAIRLTAAYTEARRGEAKTFRTEVHVFTVRGAFVALCFDAPAGEFEGLRGDFAQLLETVDLFPTVEPSGGEAR